MNYFVVLLLSMLFCHIIDDYYLQGWLASAKQKSWWEKNSPNALYKNDYKCALIEHAFSWTCMIHIPVVLGLYKSNIFELYSGTWKLIIITFATNWIIHAMVDNLKANKNMINLCTDQIIHFVQIFITCCFWYFGINGV